MTLKEEGYSHGTSVKTEPENNKDETQLKILSLLATQVLPTLMQLPSANATFSNPGEQGNNRKEREQHPHLYEKESSISRKSIL